MTGVQTCALPISDTTLLQTVIGSSVSLALRNLLILVGGLVMLAVTSVKLTGIVLAVVPVVVVPILTFGRRVRTLSRSSQDRIADVGAYAEEMINAIRTCRRSPMRQPTARTSGRAWGPRSTWRFPGFGYARS